MGFKSPRARHLWTKWQKNDRDSPSKGDVPANLDPYFFSADSSTLSQPHSTHIIHSFLISIALNTVVIKVNEEGL